MGKNQRHLVKVRHFCLANDDIVPSLTRLLEELGNGERHTNGTSKFHS